MEAQALSSRYARTPLKPSTRALIEACGEDRYLCRNTEIFKRDVIARLMKAARASGRRRVVLIETDTELE